MTTYKYQSQWTNIPFAGGDRTQLANYWLFEEIHSAIMERANITGDRFPPASQVWGGGKVVAAYYDSDGCLTSIDCEAYQPIGNKPAAAHQDLSNWSDNRWLETQSEWNGEGDAYWEFRQKDVVFELSLNPRDVLRSGITGSSWNGSVATLTFDRIWTFGQNVVGKQVVIIYRNVGRNYWWTDRWLRPPNDLGTFMGVFQDITGSVLTDPNASWDERALVGKYVFTNDTTIVLNRTTYAQITANDATTITVGAWSVGAPSAGPYTIYDNNTAWWRADNVGYDQPWRWYDQSNASELRASHEGDGTYTSVGVPLDRIKNQDGLGIYPDGYVYPFGQDASNPTFPPDDLPYINGYAYLWTPNIWKGLRGNHNWIFNNCNSFVPKANYNNAVTAIPNYCPATLFHQAGVGWSTTCTVGKDGVASVTGIPKQYKEVFWAILNYDGTVQQSSGGNTNFEVPVPDFVNNGNWSRQFAPWVSDGTGHTYPCTPVVGGDWQKTVVIATGPFRSFSREVRYIYAAYWFLAGQDEDGDVVDPDPSDDSTAGYWYVGGGARQASGAYQEYDEHGVAWDVTPFVDGDLVRYAGDRWYDPSGNGAGDPTGTGPDPWADWYIHKGDWERSDDQKASMSGVVTATDTDGLYDSTKNWFFNGAQCTHSGTATSASPGGISDSTIDPTNHYWDGSTGRFTGFTITILQPGGGPCDGLKRYITGQSGGTISFASVPGLSLHYMKDDKTMGTTQYQIVEPRFRVNIWKDRTIKITHNGITTQGTIYGNDTDKLYVTGVVPLIGDHYEIVEFTPGQTLLRTAGGWQLSDDTNSKGVQPTTIKTGGRHRKWDLITPEYFNEMRLMLNELVWTQGSVVWRSSGDNVVFYNNYDEGHYNGENLDDPDQIAAGRVAWLQNFTQVQYNGPPYGQMLGTLPTQYNSYQVGNRDIHVTGDPAGPSYSYAGIAQIKTQWNYIWVTGVPNGIPASPMASITEMYCLADIPDIWKYPQCMPYDISPTPSETKDVTANVFWNENGMSQGVYTIVSTVGPTTDLDRVGDRIGGNEQPGWGSTAAPAEYPAGTDGFDFCFSRLSSYKGYEVQKALAIHKYDVTGGLKFLTTTP